MKNLIHESNWQFISPFPALSHKSSKEGNKFILSSNGDVKAVSWWRGVIDNLEKGSWYKASVKAEIKDIASPGISVFAAVSKHLLAVKNREGDVLTLEVEFLHENDDNGFDFDLFLRAADKGKVEYFEPVIYEIDEPKHRTVKAATVRFDPERKLNGLDDQRKRIEDYLERAGRLDADVVLLTEFCTIEGVGKYANDYLKAAEQVPSGPTCQLLAAQSKKHNMYVIAGIVETDGPHYYNTAVIFDRQGSFIGKYRKTHITYGELMEGISPGDQYPVFDLDFGRVAIQTCYDQWFPEVCRYYAYKGAEIVFEPVMGGKPITWRTRAIDNGVYIVTAGWTPPSMIIDSSGKILAENHHDGIAFTELNLDYRKVNVYNDPTLIYGMPGIAPAMRMTTDNNSLDELHKIMKGQ